MRFLVLATVLAALSAPTLVLGQQAETVDSRSANDPQERLALSDAPAKTSAARARLACAPLVGQVFNPNGAPLLGATLLVKGTHDVYVTDSEGKFELSNPVYEGQTLVVGAAGYVAHEVKLDDCVLPRLVLEQMPDARIRQKGRRAGQVTRLHKRSTTLK